MRGEDTFIRTQESLQGNRLGRRNGKIIKDAPIGYIFTVFSPNGLEPLGQSFICGGMFIFAEPQEGLSADFPSQFESFRP